ERGGRTCRASGCSARSTSFWTRRRPPSRPATGPPRSGMRTPPSPSTPRTRMPLPISPGPTAHWPVPSPLAHPRPRVPPSHPISLSEDGDGGRGPSSFAHGRYEVKRFLGEGGKKKVYLAHDSLLDR